MKKRKRVEITDYVRKRWWPTVPEEVLKQWTQEAENQSVLQSRMIELSAWEFLNKQIEQVRPDEINNKWRKAIIDLLRSDIPLDGGIRGLIATDLSRYYFPNLARDRRNMRQTQLDSFIAQKQFLVEHSGKTPTKAAELIAKHWKLNVEALRQRIKRASRERKKLLNKIGTKTLETVPSKNGTKKCKAVPHRE
jgi:hypothetical protein